jgi:hypothetical protein
VSGINIVKCLDHRTSQLLRDPVTFRHAAFDGVDAAVALWIVVSRVDYHDARGYVFEQISRQTGDIFFGDGHDYDVAGVCRLFHVDWCRTRFSSEFREGLRPPRIRYEDLMSRYCETTRYNSALPILPAPMIPIFMFLSFAPVGRLTGLDEETGFQLHGLG